MPILNSCCFCFSLETGTMIIAWKGLVSYILSTISAIIAIAEIDKNFCVCVSGINSDEWRIPLKSGLYVLMTCGLIGILLHAFLIHGINNKKKAFLVPWLVTNAIPLILGLLTITIGGLVLYFIEYRAALILHFLILPMWGYPIYLWLCILSYYQQLRDNENNGMEPIIFNME